MTTSVASVRVRLCRLIAVTFCSDRAEGGAPPFSLLTSPRSLIHSNWPRKITAPARRLSICTLRTADFAPHLPIPKAKHCVGWPHMLTVMWSLAKMRICPAELVVGPLVACTSSSGSSKRANVLVSANDPEVTVKFKITLRQGKIRLARIRHSDI